MKKLLSLLMVGMLCLTGCSMDSGHEDQKDSDGKVIGVSLSTLNNPFFVSIKEGIEDKAKELDLDVKFVDANNDAAKQNNDVDDLIQEKVKVLIVNPVDSATIGNSVEAANKADIPVITLDRKSDKGKVASFIASDNIAGGKMAAEYIESKIGKDGKVLELEGIAGASATRERGQGFEEGAKNLDIVSKQSADFDRGKGLSVTENALQANKDIKAIFAQNDEMALGAAEACKAAKLKDIVIVGFDGNDDALKAVKDGELSATVAQQPVDMGKKAIEVADKLIKKEKVEAEIKIPLKLEKHE